MPVTDSYLVLPCRESYVNRPEAISTESPVHEELEIKCFYEGSSTLVVESQTISVKAGDVVVISPYEFHATVDIGEEKGKYHLVMLSLEYFSQLTQLDLRKLFLGDQKKFQTLVSGDPQLYEALMHVAQLARQQQPYGELAIKGLLLYVVTQLLQRGMTDSQAPVPEKTDLRLYTVIDPALKCIKSRYAEHLTVSQLAELCNVSKHYFCRVFKAVTKKSAMEYLRDFRLRVADTMLSGTDKSVSEISACCGFESPNYFSRCYKQYYGESPRRNYRGK